MISFISSLEIIVVVPDPNIFLWTAASVAAAPAVNPTDIKTLLANHLSTFPIKGNPVSRNGPKRLPKFYISWGIICKSFTKPWNLCISY